MKFRGLEIMAMRGKQEKAQVCGISYGSEKSGQVKNGGAGGGAVGGACCFMKKLVWS